MASCVVCIAWTTQEATTGVVLISYTWGDDSTKCIAIKDPQARLNILLNSLQVAVPDFVNALIPEILIAYTTMIDWQDELNYYGAFKLNYPGQDPLNQSPLLPIPAKQQ